MDLLHLLLVEQQSIDAGLVELRPRKLAQPGISLIIGPGRLVGAGAGEGIEDIRDGNDARLQRDLPVVQSVWVTASVHGFVMRLGDVAQEVQSVEVFQAEIVGDRLYHLQAAHRVLLHLLALRRRQPGGLEQNAVGQGEFADVVQGSELEDALDGGVVERGGAGRCEVLGDQARVAGHPVDVATGFRVTEVHHVVGRLDRRGENPHREHFRGDDGRDEVAIDVERAQRRLGQHARTARIEEDESPEGAVEIHRDGIAPTVPILRYDSGMEVAPPAE